MHGDTVGVGCEKRNEFIPTALAIVMAGATFTCYEPKCGRAMLKHKLHITQPKYFITSKKFWDLNKNSLQDAECIKKILAMDEPFDSDISTRSLIENDVDVELFEPAKVQGQTHVAFVLYSSGTTGLSKGVKLTHLNCILNSLPYDFSDESIQTVLVSGKWYHNYVTFVTYKFLVSGKKIIYNDDPNTDLILQFIDQYKVDVYFSTPTRITNISKQKNINQYNLDSLKIIYSRSSPLHEKTIEHVTGKLAKLKAVLQGYGMTEAGELSSECWGPQGPKPGSVGVASPGITLKVIDPETRKTVGPNVRGEIFLKGPVLMKGYVGMDLSSYLDDEGFFGTGDLGYSDEEGYFYIVGRLKEIIIYNGFNIPPLELETILQMHSGVKEASVVGKPVPVLGELPTAFVVRQPGSDVTERELIDFVNDEVPLYMQLRGGVKFVEELPKNLRGKVLRQELKDMLK